VTINPEQTVREHVAGKEGKIFGKKHLLLLRVFPLKHISSSTPRELDSITIHACTAE